MLKPIMKANWQNLAKKWTMPISNWKPAINRFAIEFGERFPQ